MVSRSVGQALICPLIIDSPITILPRPKNRAGRFTIILQIRSSNFRSTSSMRTNHELSLKSSSKAVERKGAAC